MAGRVFNYNRPRATASNLIGKFGVDAELRQNGVDYPTKVVLSDYKSSQIDGTLIMKGDFIGLVAAVDLPVVPLVGAVLWWQDRERTIKNVTVVQPGPDKVMYTLQLKGVR